jgi:glycosyltransferase involved in cell wall biosynthesis
MKILFLNNFYYMRGGSEKVLFEEMRMLREAGHEVAIFARGHEKNESSEYAEFFPPSFDTEQLSPSLAALRTVKELIYSDAARRGLRRVIDRFKPDIAHAHNIYGRLSLSVIDELSASGIPVVMTLHDLKLFCPSYLMLNHGRICERCKGNKFYNVVVTKCHKNSYLASSVYALETWFNHSFKKYDLVKYFIAPSMFLHDKAVEFGWNPGTIEHIPNFIDMKTIAASEVTGDYCLYLGRLSREKGVKTLLMALKDLRVKTELIVAGDGPDRDALQKIAINGALPATFTGYLNGAEVKKTITGAKVIIMPSEWYENAPLSLLEAFAWGKPVIGARIGGIPEMIDGGVNGYLFEPGNATDLRNKLEMFLALPSDRVLEMGRAARSKVEREYSAGSHYERLMQAYGKALGKACA